MLVAWKRGLCSGIELPLCFSLLHTNIFLNADSCAYIQNVKRSTGTAITITPHAPHKTHWSFTGRNPAQARVMVETRMKEIAETFTVHRLDAPPPLVLSPSAELRCLLRAFRVTVHVEDGVVLASLDREFETGVMEIERVVAAATQWSEPVPTGLEPLSALLPSNMPLSRFERLTHTRVCQTPSKTTVYGATSTAVSKAARLLSLRLEAYRETTQFFPLLRAHSMALHHALSPLRVALRPLRVHLTLEGYAGYHLRGPPEAVKEAEAVVTAQRNRYHHQQVPMNPSHTKLLLAESVRMETHTGTLFSHEGSVWTVVGETLEATSNGVRALQSFATLLNAVARVFPLPSCIPQAQVDALAVTHGCVVEVGYDSATNECQKGDALPATEKSMDPLQRSLTVYACTYALLRSFTHAYKQHLQGLGLTREVRGPHMGAVKELTKGSLSLVSPSLVDLYAESPAALQLLEQRVRTTITAIASESRSVVLPEVVSRTLFGHQGQTVKGFAHASVAVKRTKLTCTVSVYSATHLQELIHRLEYQAAVVKHTRERVVMPPYALGMLKTLRGINLAAIQARFGTSMAVSQNTVDVYATNPRRIAACTAWLGVVGRAVHTEGVVIPIAPVWVELFAVGLQERLVEIQEQTETVVMFRAAEGCSMVVYGARREEAQRMLAALLQDLKPRCLTFPVSQSIRDPLELAFETHRLGFIEAVCDARLYLSKRFTSDKIIGIALDETQAVQAFTT